jgi:hypothetical protein
MAKTRIKGTQIFETPALFELIDDDSTRNEWVVRLRDAIYGDEPSFTVPLTTGSKAKKSQRDVTLDEVCRVGFRELNEGRGVLFLTEYRNGLPVYQAIVASSPGWSTHMKNGAVPVFRPLWSTHPERTRAGLPFHLPQCRTDERRAS